MSLPNPPSNYFVTEESGSKFLNFNISPDVIMTRIEIYGTTGKIFDNTTATNKILIPSSITGEHDTVGYTENNNGWGSGNNPPEKVNYL